MPVALILVLLAVGSVLFHVMSPWWFSPLASNWGYMDSTIVITFWITGVVYVAIILFMAYCVLRFRHREGVRAAYNPENKKLEWWLTIGTAVGVAAMLAPGLVVWNDFITVPKEATTDRGPWSAVDVELPPAREGRRPRHSRYEDSQRRKSTWANAE